jgi:hypothetical protein
MIERQGTLGLALVAGVRKSRLCRGSGVGFAGFLTCEMCGGGWHGWWCEGEGGHGTRPAVCLETPRIRTGHVLYSGRHSGTRLSKYVVVFTLRFFAGFGMWVLCWGAVQRTGRDVGALEAQEGIRD